MTNSRTHLVVPILRNKVTQILNRGAVIKEWHCFRKVVLTSIVIASRCNVFLIRVLHICLEMVAVEWKQSQTPGS